MLGVTSVMGCHQLPDPPPQPVTGRVIETQRGSGYGEVGGGQGSGGSERLFPWDRGQGGGDSGVEAAWSAL